MYSGYLNKDITFCDIVYFETKNIQNKKLVNGVTDRFKISLIDGDGNKILSNFKISIVLHIVYCLMEVGNDLPLTLSYLGGGGGNTPQSFFPLPS